MRAELYGGPSDGETVIVQSPYLRVLLKDPDGQVWEHIYRHVPYTHRFKYDGGFKVEDRDKA